VRIAVLVIGVLIGLIVLGVILVPEGEVATLLTFASDGTEHETQVWVVEGNGLPAGESGEVFLRTGSRARWLARLRAKPQVELERDDERRAYLAVVEESAEVRDRVNEAMAKKYGLPNRLLGSFADARKAVPVRLVPDPTRQPAQEDAAPH
jgi:hypothetical protein